MSQLTQPHHIAHDVTGWTALGVTLPDELTDAIAVFEALRYTEVGYRPVFDLAAVTADNAEAKIREYADQLVLSDAAGGQSVLDKAKKHAVENAARRVNQLARAAVPGIIEQLSPEFDDRVESYADAVLKLPVDFTAESLIDAGSDLVTAYGHAKQEAAYLNRVADWAASINSLPGNRAQYENVLGIVRPSSGEELAKLDEAARTTGNPTLAALNPVWVAAVRSGIEFGINTPREAADLRRRLQTAMREQRRPQNVAYMPANA